MKIEIDSAAFPAARRLESWRGIICDTYVGLDSGFANDSFQSVIKGHSIGDHTLTRVTASSRHHVERSRTLIKRDGLDILFFGFAVSGRFVMTQAGREAIVAPGAIAFNDATRPFRTHFGQGIEMGWLGVPKKAFEDRMVSVEDLTAVPFGPSMPVQQITFDFLAGLGRVLDRGIPDKDADILFEQALDLLAMMLTGRPPGEDSPAARRLIRLRRVKAYVDDHLHRADLSRESAAAALCLSQREIDQLFASESTTFDQHVLARRLDGSLTFLSSPARLHPSIRDLATLWGFADTDHFRRAFEARFGLLPDDIRTTNRS